MQNPLKLGVATIISAALAAGASAPAAAAQPERTTVAQHGAIRETSSQDPASLAARQAISAAAFEKASPRRLNLTVRGDDRLRDDVQLREKEGWSEDEGFQFRQTKIAYTRRF